VTFPIPGNSSNASSKSSPSAFQAKRFVIKQG